MNKPYIIMRNNIDHEYKLLRNKPDVSEYDMCLCSGTSIEDVLWDAQAWFDIRPSEVEL